MKLSKRLEAVATLVEVGKRVIDVGCDHAYLDIYLTENNDNKCIATDINRNALNIAEANIKKYNLQDKIETKLTNGLTDIKIYKKDKKYYLSKDKMSFVVCDDDVTYTVLNTLVLEKHGKEFTCKQLADFWKERLPYACTAEYATMIGFRQNKSIKEIGTDIIFG